MKNLAGLMKQAQQMQSKMEEMQEALVRLGHSPLVVDAFRQRRAADAARSAA